MVATPLVCFLQVSPDTYQAGHGALNDFQARYPTVLGKLGTIARNGDETRRQIYCRPFLELVICHPPFAICLHPGAVEARNRLSATATASIAQRQVATAGRNSRLKHACWLSRQIVCRPSQRSPLLCYPVYVRGGALWVVSAVRMRVTDYGLRLVDCALRPTRSPVGYCTLLNKAGNTDVSLTDARDHPCPQAFRRIYPCEFRGSR